jgi:hypothetical protein
MKTPISPSQIWSVADGETVLREESVDRVLRDKGEGNAPLMRFGQGLVLLAFGGYFGFQRTLDFFTDTTSYSDLFGLLLGVLMTAAGLFLLIRRPRKSQWKAMDKYVFTNRQIVLLDDYGNLMDQIQISEIEDVIQPDNFISVIRKNDPELENMFSINYIYSLDELFEFTKATYKVQP